MEIVILTSPVMKSSLVRYLGPYQIAWWIRSHGYTVQVLDFFVFLSESQRINLLSKFITQETKIVALAPFTTMYTSNKEAKEYDIFYNLVAYIRDKFPWVKLVAGGVAVPSLIKSDLKFDAIFKGEGEHSFLRYCDHVIKGSKSGQFSFINNKKIFTPDGVFEIAKSRQVYEVNDFILPGESVPFESSRGCIFKCKFCQHPNLGKDKDDFIKEMSNIEYSLNYNYDNFNITRYHMADDTFNSHRGRFKEFHSITQRLPFDIKWISYIRMDLLDIWPEQLDMVIEAGCESAYFGVESLNEESCRQIGKGWGAKNHKQFITKLGDKWGDKIKIVCSLIAGLGNETESDWDESNEFLRQSHVHNWLFFPLMLAPEYGMSEFDKNYASYGYTIDSAGHWVKGDMNYHRAKRWVDHVMKRDSALKKPTMWSRAVALNFGLSDEYLSTHNINQVFGRIDSELLREKFINSYYDTAMRY